MSAFLHIEERDKELYGKFLSLRRDGVDYYDSIRRAARSPCSQYWISEHHLYKTFLRFKKSGVTKTNCRRQGVHLKLYNDYLRIKDRKEFKNCSLEFIISFLINRPAPSFYMSDERAYKIIRRMHSLHAKKIKEKYEKLNR